MKNIFDMLNQIYRGAEISGKRSPLDFFADKIRQASTEQNILSML